MGNSTKVTKKRKATKKLSPLLTNHLGIDEIATTRSSGLFSDFGSTFSVQLTPEEETRRSMRMNRFVAVKQGVERNEATELPGRQAKARRYERLIGESLCLEKPYLRLTTFPKKQDVRPAEVLIKALAHIKGRYIFDEGFEWANEQLKSVRQDLTVQRIRKLFVLDVYETHARILLEHGDLNEFNQCQTVIQSLVEGSNHTDDLVDIDQEDLAMREEKKYTRLRQSAEASDEFHAYGILYALVRNSRIDLKRAIARSCWRTSGTTIRTTYETSTEHAIQVVKSVDANDYGTFFRLYESAPHMSAYLMDFLVKRVRDKAYQRIIAAFRPNVSVEHVREWLCFEDIEGARQFARQNGAVFIEEKGETPFWIDCKASVSRSLCL